MFRKLPLLRLLSLAALALLVPGIPFLLLGKQLEASLTQLLVPDWSPMNGALFVIGLLSVDLFLPVPSSAVSTFAGSLLGPAWGALAVWLGMTAGALLGFLLARFAGPQVVNRLASAEDVDRLRRLNLKWGTGLLIVTRPVPLLAEAAVVLAGSLRLPWQQFLLPVALTNLAVATAYACLGHVSRQSQWLLLALLAAVAIPVAATVLLRWLLPIADEDTTVQQQQD